MGRLYHERRRFLGKPSEVWRLGFGCNVSDVVRRMVVTTCIAEHFVPPAPELAPISENLGTAIPHKGVTTNTAGRFVPRARNTTPFRVHPFAMQWAPHIAARQESCRSRPLLDTSLPYPVILSLFGHTHPVPVPHMVGPLAWSDTLSPKPVIVRLLGDHHSTQVPSELCDHKHCVTLCPPSP